VLKEWTKRRKAGPAWAELIETRAFSIAMIVASAKKAQRLRRFLRVDDGSIPVEVVHYPELLKLMPTGDE
jgi:hypothetical protein